jgi:hypothetical protein
MNSHFNFSKIIVCLLLGLGAVSSVSAQEFITNGSLTGPISNAGVPPDWVIYSPSPDTMDENNNVGVPLPGAPFGVTPSGPSADGGTWVGFGSIGGDAREIFGQIVTGLTIGEEYELSWYAGNFGAESGSSYTATNAIEVYLDGSPFTSGELLTLSSSWVTQSIFFTATATSHQLSFGVLNDDLAYLSIDGISLFASGPPIPPAALVPVPTLSQWALILLSMLLGLMAFANRKRLF